MKKRQFYNRVKTKGLGGRDRGKPMPDRILPVYLVVDVSGSMEGLSIERVREVVRCFLDECYGEPLAREHMWVGVIAFCEAAREASPLSAAP